MPGCDPQSQSSSLFCIVIMWYEQLGCEAEGKYVPINSYAEARL